MDSWRLSVAMKKLLRKLIKLRLTSLLDVLRRKDRLACNADLGCATMVAIKMAVESFRQSKTLLWDAKEEKVRMA